MELRTPRAGGYVCALAIISFGLGLLLAGTVAAQTDSLELQVPTNVRVIPQMTPDRSGFINYLFWDDIPNATGAYVHPPDTVGLWNPPTSSTPQTSLSTPMSSGVYTGDVDRTVTFFALNTGTVGVTGSVVLRYDLIGEEQWSGTLDVGSGYTAGDPIACVFTHEVTQEPLDLGLNVHFTAGIVDSNGIFLVGLEDFEGYHVYRGVAVDGSDMTNIGEMSKQEAFAGSDVDSLILYNIIPALRSTGVYDLPFPVPGLGSRIDIRNVHPNGRLGPNEMAWFDSNAFNGFTYQYVVTTFDRGYNVRAHRQGLFKFDHCPVTQGVPYPCPSEIVTVSTKVSAQNVMREIYAVPNPYRSGSTQFSAPNYHNYPDNMIRFVNVPSQCELRIFTPAGDLVRTLRNTNGTGVIEWDARNESGSDVTSGVYIFRCERVNGDSMYGRVIIIR